MTAAPTLYGPWTKPHAGPTHCQYCPDRGPVRARGACAACYMRAWRASKSTGSGAAHTAPPAEATTPPASGGGRAGQVTAALARSTP